MIKVGGALHKCPNFDLCKNQGNTDPEKKNHWAEKSCPKKKQHKTAANVISSENSSTSSPRYGLRNSTQVKVGTIFKSAINMVKSLSSNLLALATKKEAHHKCANFEKCKGQGNIDETRNKHYKTSYCPLENEKEGLNINKKQIELENANRVYVRQIEMEVTNDLVEPKTSNNVERNIYDDDESNVVVNGKNNTVENQSVLIDDTMQDADTEKDKESFTSIMNNTIVYKMVEPITRRLSASASIIFE